MFNFSFLIEMLTRNLFFFSSKSNLHNGFTNVAIHPERDFWIRIRIQSYSFIHRYSLHKKTCRFHIVDKALKVKSLSHQFWQRWKCDVKGSALFNSRHFLPKNERKDEKKEVWKILDRSSVHEPQTNKYSGCKGCFHLTVEALHACERWKLCGVVVIV